jgi:hypothetical protein
MDKQEIKKEIAIRTLEERYKEQREDLLEYVK